MNFSDIVGPHPTPPNPIGIHTSASDEKTLDDTPHRILKNVSIQSPEFLSTIREWLIKHHVSPANIERDRKRREALERHGFTDTTERFPTNPKTQKGNWGEIFLAEYLDNSGNGQFPIYRLRYNPNIDQSMKGDDVIAFDLNSNPITIIVGEAKFRATSAKQAVEQIVSALTQSQTGGLPTSLSFIVDRLFEEGEETLAQAIDNCHLLFAQKQLQINHVGFLVSDENTAAHIKQHTASSIQNLAMMSLILESPNEIIENSFENIEGDL